MPFQPLYEALSRCALIRHACVTTQGRVLVHDEALNAAGEVINITQVRRGGLSTKGCKCAGESPDGAKCLRPVTACALDSEFKAPYFAGSHVDGCSRRSKRSDDKPGDRGYVTTAGPRVSQWRVSYRRNSLNLA